MLDYTDYAQVFGDEPFIDRSWAGDADALRKALDGQLFIDRVLKTLGIIKSKIYPPKNGQAMRNFHRDICTSNISVHHRLSIFYYVLLDMAPPKVQSIDMATSFANASGLPKRYQTLMKGLYYLDKHQFLRALDYITHPSLIPDFSDDIVTVLSLNAPPDDYTLVLTYYNTVQPALKTSRALTLYFEALSRTSIPQALAYSRTHSNSTREVLFGQLISTVVDGAGNNSGAERAVEFVSSVFDADEEKWFEEYLTHGKGKNLKKAHDTLVMRKIITGRYSEAVNERGISSQWGGVIEGVKNGLGCRI